MRLGTICLNFIYLYGNLTVPNYLKRFEARYKTRYTGTVKNIRPTKTNSVGYSY